MRCRISVRGSSANKSSLSSMLPADEASRVITSAFISPPLPRQLRRSFRQRPLYGVAQHDPAAFCARNRAADKDQAPLYIGTYHLQVLRGDPLVAIMPGHFLTCEGLAGVLAVAGRTVAAVRDRDAVSCAQAAEVPALHGAREPLADARAC